MSTMTNRIATVFTASAGNVRAVMGEVAGGMQNVGRSAMETNRQTGYLSNQFRALGTTIRYAIAGQAIFGAVGMVRNLQNLQTQMALMSTLTDSLTTSTQNMFQSSSGLKNRLDELQKGSLASLTPVNELADSTVNLLSSVQNLNAEDVTKITTELAQSAQLAQTPVDDLTKGVTGMIQAFGKKPSKAVFEEFSRGFLTVTRRAPGGIAAGPQIVQQLGPAALSAQLAHVSPQQMLGLTTTVLRAGGSPATAMRGLNFLMQSIATPNKSEAKVLRGIGITPEFVQKEGGVAAIIKLAQAMKAKGVRGDISRNAPIFMADEEVLGNIEQVGQGDMTGLGVSGEGLQLGQRAIGRIHGVRAMMALLRGMTSGTLSSDIQAQANAFNGAGKEGQAVADQFKDFRQKQPLRAAAIALQGIALEAPRALEGLIDPVARQIDRIGQLAVDHPKGTRRVMQGAAAFVAALGVGRFLGVGRLGKGLLGRIGAGSGFVAERAITAATNPANAGQLGGSPQNPMFVMVVGTIFGTPLSGGRPGDKMPPGGGGFMDKAERQAKRFPWLIPAMGTAAKFGAKVAPFAAAAEFPAAGDALQMLLGHDPYPEHASRKMNRYPPFVRKFFKLNERNQLVPRKGTPQSVIDALNQSRPDRSFLGIPLGHRDPNLQQANRLIRQAAQGGELGRLNRILAPFHRRDPTYGVQQIFGGKKEMIHGKAVISLDVNLKSEKGTVRKTIHVPMDLWSGGKTPSQRGQPGKVKNNVP